MLGRHLSPASASVSPTARFHGVRRLLASLASSGSSPPLFLCSLSLLLPSSFLGLFSIWETKIFPGPQAVCTAGGGGRRCSTFSRVGRTPSGAGPAAVSPPWTFGAAEKLGLLGMALQFR